MSVTLPGINIPSYTISLGALATNEFLILLVVGLIAGFLASRYFGSRHGLVLYIVVGVIGAFLGSWLFGLFNINLGPGVIPMVIVAFVGAILLLAVLHGLTGGIAHRRGGHRRRAL